MTPQAIKRHLTSLATELKLKRWHDIVSYYLISKFREFNLSFAGKEWKSRCFLYRWWEWELERTSTEGNLTIFIKITNANILFNLEISVPGFYLSHIFAYIRHKIYTCLLEKGNLESSPNVHQKGFTEWATVPPDSGILCCCRKKTRKPNEQRGTKLQPNVVLLRSTQPWD